MVQKHISRNIATGIRQAICCGCLTMLLGANLIAEDSIVNTYRSPIPESGVIQRLMTSPTQATDSTTRSMQNQNERYVENHMRTSRPAATRPSSLTGHDSSFQRAIHVEPNNRDSTGYVTRVAHDELLVPNTPRESFLDRESEAKKEPAGDPKELITRLGVNLVFVLIFASGCLFLIKQWQNSKNGITNQSTDKMGRLAVNQVHKLSNGSSLHVVNVSGNQFLVAVDSSGIKSVNPLVQSFDDTLRRTRPYGIVREDIEPEPIVHDETTAEIDEKLMSLLLKKTRTA